MLRIKIDLVPFGDESQARQIAEMVVANVGQDANGYSYEAWTAADSRSGEPAMYGKLSGYDRSQSVWELIRLMLEAIRLESHKPTSDTAKRLKKRLGKIKE